MTVRVVLADEPGALALAVAALRRGELVAIPTETVYGLAALARDEAAIARVFAAKGRPKAHPLIVHVVSASAASTYGIWSSRAEALADRFWPGPLTLVVPKRDNVSALVTGGGDSVALRAPRHPIARSILELLGEAFVAPSANRYQSISPTRAEHVAASLANAPVDVLVLDGGSCSEGLESTVVDVRGPTARILRPGMISREEVAEALGADVEAGPLVMAAGAARASPGMDERHYAPRAKLENVASRAAAIARAAAAGEHAVRVSFGVGEGAVSLTADAAGASRELSALLHRLDAAGATHVIVEKPPEGGAWDALRDRLSRAAALPGES
ncbi:L-threonylcarbamoyladenylate synthase [soil metagenome]